MDWRCREKSLSKTWSSSLLLLLSSRWIRVWVLFNFIFSLLLLALSFAGEKEWRRTCLKENDSAKQSETKFRKNEEKNNIVLYCRLSTYFPASSSISLLEQFSVSLRFKQTDISASLWAATGTWCDFSSSSSSSSQNHISHHTFTWKSFPSAGKEKNLSRQPCQKLSTSWKNGFESELDCRRRGENVDDVRIGDC